MLANNASFYAINKAFAVADAAADTVKGDKQKAEKRQEVLKTFSNIYKKAYDKNKFVKFIDGFTCADLVAKEFSDLVDKGAEEKAFDRIVEDAEKECKSAKVIANATSSIKPYSEIYEIAQGNGVCKELNSIMENIPDTGVFIKYFSKLSSLYGIDKKVIAKLIKECKNSKNITEVQKIVEPCVKLYKGVGDGEDKKAIDDLLIFVDNNQVTGTAEAIEELRSKGAEGSAFRAMLKQVKVDARDRTVEGIREQIKPYIELYAIAKRQTLSETLNGVFEKIDAKDIKTVVGMILDINADEKTLGTIIKLLPKGKEKVEDIQNVIEPYVKLRGKISEKTKFGAFIKQTEADANVANGFIDLSESGITQEALDVMTNFFAGKNNKEKLEQIKIVKNIIDNGVASPSQISETLVQVNKLSGDTEDVIKKNFLYLIEGLDGDAFEKLNGEISKKDRSEDKIASVLKKWRGNVSDNKEEEDLKNVKIINGLLRCGADIDNMATLNKEEVVYLNDIKEVESKKDRSVEDILKELNVKDEDRKVIFNQLKTLDVFTAMGYLQAMIKTYNSGIGSTGSKEVELISVSEIKANKKDFPTKSTVDLYEVWKNAYARTELSEDTKDFLNRVQAYTNKFSDKPWLDFWNWTDTGKEGALKNKLNSQVEELKKKELNFNEDTKIISRFVNTHYDRARDAANFLDRLDNLNDIIKNNEKGSAKYIDAKKDKKKLLSEDGHYFIDKGSYKAGRKIVGKGIVVSLICLGVIALCSFFAWFPGTLLAIAAICVGVGSVINSIRGALVDTGKLRLKESDLKKQAQAQLDKSNKALSATIGQRLLRANQDNPNADGKVPDSSAKYTGEVHEAGKGLRLAKLKGDLTATISSEKLEGLGGEEKKWYNMTKKRIVKSSKNETVYSSYTKEYLEKTDALKKSLLQSLGDLSSDPSYALKHSEVTSIENPGNDLAKEAFNIGK